MELSIVVGTKDRPDSWERFIQSVHRTINPGIDYEVVVGDASQHGRYVCDDGNTRRLVEEEPLGTLRGYNRCFRQCQGRWVAWFNDDCELLTGWFDAACSFMVEHSRVGLGAIYFKDRQEDGRYGPFQIYDYPNRTFHKSSGSDFTFLPGIPHANFGVIRRELGDELDWFDEEMGCVAYGCDTSLCLKVVDAGLAVARIPDCKVIHHRAFDAGMNERLDSIRVPDLEKFEAKWKSRFPELLAKHARYKDLLGPRTIE